MKFRISFTVRIPGSPSIEDVTAWARFVLGQTGDLLVSNPLSEFELDAEYVEVNAA